MEPPSRPQPEHGGPVPEPAQIKPAKRIDFAATDARARSLESSNRRVLRGFLLLATIATVGLAAFIALTPRSQPPGPAKFTLFYANDIASEFKAIARDDYKKGTLTKLGDVRGERFYEAAFKTRLLDEWLLDLLVSGRSPTDERAGADWIRRKEPMPPNSCSFTAPRADMLLEVLTLEGDQRCVVLCFNSRNWNNFPDHGVVVFFSDATRAEYMTFEDARDDWGITEEEWADPAGKLFGKKAPFQHTYE